MSEQTAEITVNLIDNATAGIARIQKALTNFAFENIDKFSKAFSNASFSGGINRVASSFRSMGSSAAGAVQSINYLSTAMQGLNKWTQSTVSTQIQMQKTLGLIATKVNDTVLKDFANSINLKVDISDPQQKIKLLNQYLRSVQKDAKNWAMGVGDFAKIAPMSANEYMGQIKQLLSSGLTATEATMATKYSAVMSKALEATHADAAYDMARIYNTMKATTKGGILDTEGTMKQISSLFDYMDNNFQFKIGKNAIVQLRKTIAVGLSSGFSLTELGIAAGTISNTGLEGGIGDTALKEFISRLSIAERKAAKAGLTFSYNFGQSLPDIIRNLNKATEGLSDKDRKNFFTDAFGERGVQAINRLINSADEMEKHIREAKKAVEGYGNAYRSAFMRSQDFATAQERLVNGIGVLNAQVGVYTVGMRWMFTDLAASSISFVGALQNSNTVIGTFVGNGIDNFLTFGGVVTAFGSDLISVASAPLQFMGNLGLAMDGIKKSMPHLKKFGNGFFDLGKDMVSLSFGAVKSLGSSILWLGKSMLSVTMGAFKLMGAGILSLGKGMVWLYLNSIKFLVLSMLWLGKTMYSVALGSFKVLSIGIWGLIQGMFSLSVTTLRAVFSQQFWTKTLWQGIAVAAKNILLLTLMNIGYAAIAIKGAVAATVSGIFWAVTAVGAWAAALPLGVIGLAFLAIVATIALVGAAVYLLWKNWDTVWSYITKSFSAAIDFVAGGFRWLWNFADKITFGFLGKLWNGMMKLFKKLWEALKKVGSWFGYYFGGDKSMIVSGEADFGDSLEKSFGGGASYGGGSGIGSGITIPEGAYAYQINKRFGNSSKVQEAIGSGTMANAAIPIDTEKDILRDIREISKNIFEKMKESDKKGIGSRTITIENATFPNVIDFENALGIINEFAEAVTRSE